MTDPTHPASERRVMPERKINKAKRSAAGYTLLGAFHVLHAAAAMADNVLRDMSRGMTEAEWEWLKKRKSHYRSEAEVLRKFAWRLINNNSTPGSR